MTANELARRRSQRLRIVLTAAINETELIDHSRKHAISIWTNLPKPILSGGGGGMTDGEREVDE